MPRWLRDIWDAGIEISAQRLHLRSVDRQRAARNGFPEPVTHLPVRAPGHEATQFQSSTEYGRLYRA